MGSKSLRVLVFFVKNSACTFVDRIPFGFIEVLLRDGRSAARLTTSLARNWRLALHSPTLQTLLLDFVADWSSQADHSVHATCLCLVSLSSLN